MNTPLRRALRAAAVCLAALPCAGQATPDAPQPDTLIFSNGDQLKGTLLRGVGQTIVFKSEMAGEITVTLDKVKELRSTGAFAVLRKDAPLRPRPFQPERIVVENGGITPAGTGAPIASNDVGFLIDAATYEHEVAIKPAPWEGWNGSITAGATLQRSTQNGSTYTAGVSLVRSVPLVSFLPPRNRTTLDFTETYGKITQPVIPQTTPPTPDSIAKTDILHADLERDEYTSKRFFALVQTAFDHNFSQGLDLQQLFGAGVGWTPLQDSRRELDLKLDIHYEKQQFETPSSNQNLIGSLFSETFHRNLQRKIVLTQTLNLLPAWNNLNAAAANGSVVVAAPLMRRLSLTLTTTDSYLHNPAPGFRKNSYQFVTGVSYTLR